jgi:uncharacterized membrane protein
VEDVALFLHLIGAFAFVSGAVLAGAAFEAARRRQSTQEIAALLGLARTGAMLVAAGFVLVLVFGLWLVDLGDWGYGSGWIEGAVGLLVAATILGALGGQTPKKARRLSSSLAAEGRPASAELRRLLDDRRSRILNYLSVPLVLAVLVLMVWKPGA